ncbi:MAG: condensation domain-containing protein, partial [Chloroflexi bacterium]|nr:condensation domain-containing protein [Chloroflexota bacterium]
ALRMRFEQVATGWQARNAPVQDEVPLECVDLSGVPADAQEMLIESRGAQLQSSLDLATGPLLRLAYFDRGEGQRGRLATIIHHLVVDGVSWLILLQDLQMAYTSLSRGEPAQLPPKTTSYWQWAWRLNEYAQSETARNELNDWLSMLPASAERMPVDIPADPAANIEASAHNVESALDPDETETLLRQVPAAYGTEINEVLLAALAQGYASWAGRRTLLVDLEGHGREDILDGIDLSRTAGWFTTVYPVLLDIRQTINPGEVLKTVKERLRRIPAHGIGYGLLRYLCDDPKIKQQLQALPQADISFNYLGQLDRSRPESSTESSTESPLFVLSGTSCGADRDPAAQRSHLLDVTCRVVAGQLRLNWTFSERFHCRTTIEGLADAFKDALRSYIAHCQSSQARGYTPSDFPLAQLDQRNLDKVLKQIKRSQGVRI